MTEEGALSLDEGGAWRYWNLWVVLVSISSYDAKHNINMSVMVWRWRSVEMEMRRCMVRYGTTSTAISRNTDRPSAQKSYNIVIPSVVVNSSVGVIVVPWRSDEGWTVLDIRLQHQYADHRPPSTAMPSYHRLDTIISCQII
jgi:hypothetical protein